MPELDAVYAERVAMQRRLDGLFPRGVSLEVVDTCTIQGVPLAVMLVPCGRVFCAAFSPRPGDEPDLYLLRFDFTESVDPFLGYAGRPWQAWMDGSITDAGAQTRRPDTWRFSVLDEDGETRGWTVYMDADPPVQGSGPRVVLPRYRRLSTERWEAELFPRGLDPEEMGDA